MSKKHHTNEQADNNKVIGGNVAQQASAVTDAEIKGDQSANLETDNNANPDTPEGAGNSEQIVSLVKELQEAKQAKEEMYNRMLRTQADFDNFRRRSRQEYEQACQFGGEDLMKKILPVLDSLERAVACFDPNAENCSWQDGVQLTLKQFQNILAAEGLEVIESLKQPFDPQVHEAVFQEQSDEVNEPTVLEELQKGYKYKNKLIRPALVKVVVP